MKPEALPVRFYRTENGREPVRVWLKELGQPDSRIIGGDIAIVQYGWPVGMPVCRPLGDGLHEIRSSLPGGRIARVLFFFAGGEAILLHGFIKKTQKTPEANVRLARERMRDYLA
jgi:phage-related protein